MTTELTSLPFFSPHTFRDTYVDQNAALIAELRATGTPEQRAAAQDAFQQAGKAEEKRVEGERKRIGEANAAVFLANPREVLSWLDAQKGTSLYLGEMLLLYGIARVELKRAGKGYLAQKGTIGEGTISPFTATVTIGQREVRREVSSRNDRRSKADAEQWMALQAAQEIVREMEAKAN